MKMKEFIMSRFVGRMTSSEKNITKKYKDVNGNLVTIYADEYEWSATFVDGNSTNHYRYPRPVEDNFNDAFATAVENAGELTEIISETM